MIDISHNPSWGIASEKLEILQQFQMPITIKVFQVMKKSNFCNFASVFAFPFIFFGAFFSHDIQVWAQKPTQEIATVRSEAIMMSLAAAADENCRNRWRRPGFVTSVDGDGKSISKILDPELIEIFKLGDEITLQNGQLLGHTSPRLQIELALGRLRVKRDETTQTIDYQAPLLCYRPVHIVSGGEVRAKTRKDGIEVSDALLEYADNDDELAFALAHELAHFARDHSQIIGRTQSFRKPSAKEKRALEAEADLYANWLLARAGYDPEIAIGFIERGSRLRNIPLLGLSNHPTRKARLKNLKNVLPVLETLKASGELNSTPFVLFKSELDQEASDATD